MIASPRPVSSPAGADSFPPPLLRFLRSGGGSKGRRGKPRSRPIFHIRGRRNSARAIEASREPSSPKVTCIGQVRESGGGGAVSHGPRRCWLLEKSRALLFPGKNNAKSHERTFSWWGLLVLPNQKGEKAESVVQDCKDGNALDESFPSPPANAVILTRCRSAPYRSSSLGGLFWGSSLGEEMGKIGIENPAKSENLQKPSWENSRIGEEKSSMKSENLVSNFQDLKMNGGGAVHPLLLARCASEPARRRLADSFEPCSRVID